MQSRLAGQSGAAGAIPSRLRTEILSRLGQFKPLAIYVFGSVAHGRERPGSDLDLAILPEKSIEPWRLFEIAQELAMVCGKEVDLIDLFTASIVMRKEVLRTGFLLDETDPGRRREFEMYTLSDYARLNEERAPVLAAVEGVDRHAR